MSHMSTFIPQLRYTETDKWEWRVLEMSFEGNFSTASQSVYAQEFERNARRDVFAAMEILEVEADIEASRLWHDAHPDDTPGQP
jgi:hypothetical protein